MGQEYPFQSTRENPIIKCFHGCISVAVMFVIVSPFTLFGIWLITHMGQHHQISTSTSMSIANLHLSGNNNSGSSLLQSLNVTFKVDMELRNKGVIGGIKYENSTIFLRYKGMDMDVVLISGARVAQRRSRNVSLSLTFDSRRVNNDDLVSSDGLLKLQTYVRFSGKGRDLIFMVYPVSETIHDLFIDPTSRIFTYRECQKQIQWRDSSDQKPLCQA